MILLIISLIVLHFQTSNANLTQYIKTQYLEKGEVRDFST